MSAPAYTPPIRRVDRGRTHWYVDANGLKVPGVTTILDLGIPKAALINWAANVTAEHAIDHWDELSELSPSERLKRLQKARYGERDRARNRGTQVHKLAEQLVAGQEVEVPEELAGHVEAYVRFLNEWDPQPVLLEFIVVSVRNGYAGTADLIADIGDQRWLLDVKTSRSGVYAENALQLAAYRHADYHIAPDGTERPLPDVDRCGVVHVRADGYDLVPVQAGPAQHRQFLYAQQIARFTEDGRDLIGDALLPPTLQEATA